MKKAVAELKTRKKVLEDKELALRPAIGKVSFHQCLGSGSVRSAQFGFLDPDPRGKYNPKSDLRLLITS